MEHLLGRAATSFFILIAILCGRINKANGQVYCPGQTSIPCLTSTQPILWDGTAFDGQCPSSSPSDTIVLNELTTANIGNTFTCGQYTVVFDNVEVVMDGGFNVTQFSSSLRFTASSSLNGLTIQCRTAGNQNAPSVDITNIIVPDIPTPIVSTSQDSLTSVTVNLTVIDTRCASLYVVEVTPEGGAPIIMNSSTSTLSVSGLDLCLNSYSAVGYIQASTGVQGSRSSPINIPSEFEENNECMENVTMTVTEQSITNSVTGVVTTPGPGCGVLCIVGTVISLVIMVLVAIIVVVAIKYCHKPRNTDPTVDTLPDDTRNQPPVSDSNSPTTQTSNV